MQQKKVCVNHLCNKTSVLKSFLQQKSVLKSFSWQKKYLKLQFDVQVRIICCFCNVLSSNHAWLYILGKAHTQLPFLTHLILVPSLGCVFLMRTCYQLIKIRQNLNLFWKVSKPNYCSTNKWECFGANSFSKHWKNTCEIVSPSKIIEDCLSINFPGYPENFPDHQKNIKSIPKLSRLSKT